MSKFHINKHGVPAPCKAQKGNCPLGGDESHFETQEEAQEYADKQNESEFGTLPEIEDDSNSFHGNYVGTYYTLSNKVGKNLSKPMNETNVKEVFDSGFKDGDIVASHERFTKENMPINFDAKISKVGNDEYQVNGKIAEYSYVEKDFDTKEDYEEYAEGEPDMSHEVSYKFTGDELRDSLMKYERIERETHPSQTPGIIISGLYYMSKDRIR